MSTDRTPWGFRLFEWIDGHSVAVTVATIVGSVVLGSLTPVVASSEDPNFSPSGEVYDTEDVVRMRFATESSIRSVVFLVEDQLQLESGDVLTAAALREFKENTDAFRAAEAGSGRLATMFDHDLNRRVEGIFSVADAVDEAIPGGLAGATDLDVKLALDRILSDDQEGSTGLRSSLSRLQRRNLEMVSGEEIVVWSAPAFLASLRYDLDRFEGEELEGFGATGKVEAEEWLRRVQTDLRGDQAHIRVIGIAIDPILVDEEGANQTAPFIFLAVAMIVLVVGMLLRSYWAAMLAAAGLGAVMMSYNGINALIGLKVQSPMINFIVPIALISFGIDFFIHGTGRIREMQIEGVSRARAYPLGMHALAAAMMLSVLSSVGAFLSNTASGIEAITEFGIAAAIAILMSYLILGLIVPKQVLVVEGALMPRPADHGLHVFRKLGFLVASVFAGIVVTLSIVMPSVGAPVYVVFLLLLVGSPFWLVRRHNRRAEAAGKPMTDHIAGHGHAFEAAGGLVHFLANHRVVTVPVAAVLAAVGVIAALRVESGFDLADFYSTRTDFVRSLDRNEVHFGSSEAGPAYIYVEGDLTAPSTLKAMEAAVQRVGGSDAELMRDMRGELEGSLNAADIVRMVTASEAARDAIAPQGVEITDADGDGLADTVDQVRAIYEYVSVNDVPGDNGITILRPDQVAGSLWVGDGLQGTRLEVIVPSVVDDRLVTAARAALDRAAAGLHEDLVGVEVTRLSVSGEAITTQDTLASFTGSMLVSLPIAIGLTMMIVLIALRSLRYALISIIPIMLVVAWLYGFMWWQEYQINVVTATIAAIAIGVGIDYTTHFTVRFREEFEGEPSRFPALRRAGEGTGSALAISALTSILGFLVMAASPMPMFASFGMLTAMMVVFALVASLLVLPSLLLLVTPSRKGDERARLEEEITHGEFEYQPHAPETAELRHPQTEDWSDEGNKT